MPPQDTIARARLRKFSSQTGELLKTIKTTSPDVVASKSKMKEIDAETSWEKTAEWMGQWVEIEAEMACADISVDKRGLPTSRGSTTLAETVAVSMDNANGTNDELFEWINESMERDNELFNWINQSLVQMQPEASPTHVVEPVLEHGAAQTFTHTPARKNTGATVVQTKRSDTLLF
jgi:hypothetical protein